MRHSWENKVQVKLINDNEKKEAKVRPLLNRKKHKMEIANIKMWT